ncbi:hypothetical protein KJ877_09600 [bacterium]|nr:hypothetical protein [bacterium]MBU1990020.1 hypothetical protein [bacterium]
MIPVKTKNIHEPVIIAKYMDDGNILVVDSKTTIRQLDGESLEIVGGFKANIEHERYKTNVVSFSSDANYFVTISADCKDSTLYNTQTKKAIGKVNRHHGEVSCVGLDPLNRYMFSCGEDGKTFVLDIKSGKLSFTLPPHADTINDISFSENGHWIATSSYDKKVSIFNMLTMSRRHRFKAHAAAVMKAQFLNKNRIFSVDKNNVGIVWHLHSGQVIARLGGIHDDVTQVTKSNDHKFLFLGTSLGYVLIYDLDTYELLDRKFIKVDSSITSLEFNATSNNLIVGTAKGEVLFFDIYSGLERIKKLLQIQDYEGVEEDVNKNIVLKYTDVYRMVSVIWDKTVEKAIDCLQNSDREGAINLFKKFKNIPMKNSIMNKIMIEYTDFDKFAMLVKQGKLPLAYTAANSNPSYKESKLYKNMELQWKKTFMLAQKYALQPRGEDKAREILSPYRGISEKTMLIQDLMTKGNVYKRFKAYLVNRDYRMALELTRKNLYLKEFSEYEALMDYADSIFIKSQKLINNGDTLEATKLLRVLLDFPEFNEEARDIMSKIESKQVFFNAVKNNDMVLAYNLLDKNEELYETKDGMMLEDIWNGDLALANHQASLGDVEGIKKTLEKYMATSSKNTALGNVFAWCYMTQLENAIKTKQEQAYIEHGIKNYIVSFGLLDQIESFYRIFKKYYPDSKLNFELLNKGSLRMWRPSMIVKSILD